MAKLCALRGPWYDTAGNILTSGLIYTYETGASSVAKTVYADPLGATSLTNPVVLDVNGCKTMYLATDTAYRFVVKTSGGTTVETIDEITPLTTLASSIGGANIDISDYSIITQAGKDLHLTPGAAGKLYLGTLQMPTAAPTSTQVLAATDATTLSWQNPNSGLLVSDSAPTLSANLVAGTYFIKYSDGGGIQDANNVSELIFYKTASAVNYMSMTNAAAGNGPTLAAVGSDTDIQLKLTGKGASGVVANIFTSTGAFTASSTSTLTGAVACASTVSVAGTLTCTTAATVGTTLNVTGTTTLAGLVQGGTTFPAATGTTDQYLRLSAAGTAAWTTSAAAGSLVYIETKTASSSSSIVFTGLSATYRAYLVVLADVYAATDATLLKLRTSTDNGSTYDSGAADYAQVLTLRWNNTSAVSDNNSTAGMDIATSLSNVAAESMSGEVWIYSHAVATYTKTKSEMIGWRSDGNFQMFNAAGCRKSSADVDAIQFIMSSGNIAAGRFSLFGLV